ncbi:hypothetical protein [Roseibacillus ishigakijimensis]|uniref:Uncharacterized protein n=1 Tax=Roseibacillus ishigakijimensis TaxID=454146 RepID=A0A934RT04_9BACT|nr:hypothetical protein [Roseibacillus ishigakijimensis]MBK1835377.1 hypothetical protein [Roseibacillus ishigakijimensis]
MSDEKPNLDFGGASLEEVKARMADRLAYIEEQRKKKESFKEKIVVEKVAAKYLGDGFARLYGDYVKLDSPQELPTDHFWVPAWKDHTGSWKMPNALIGDYEVPTKGGVTSDGKKYLTVQAERYDQFSKQRQYFQKDNNGKEVIRWQGLQDYVPAEIKSRFRDGTYGGKWTTVAEEAAFTCLHLDKIFSKDFPPEVWTALEHAYHAGRHSKLVDLHDTLSQDLTNHEMTRRQREGKARKKASKLPKWKQTILLYRKEHPEITPPQIREELLKGGILTETANGRFKWKGDSKTASKQAVHTRIRRFLNSYKSEE